MSDYDTLQRFLFENSHVRGEFVHLRASYQAVGQRHAYPAPVLSQLGEALAASALLAATIKFGGSLILQAQGNGPLNMLVAQCTDQHHVRGLARWQHEVPQGNLNAVFGDGHLAITINTHRRDDRYQGIVGLDGERLADAIERYFAQSEQLETRLWLAADAEQAVGMLLQHVPGQHDPDPDLWQRIEMLGATLSRAELLTLPRREILHRLFHEEDVRLFDATPVSFRCGCSRDKIIDVLRALGPVDIRQLLAEQGHVSVRCEFCNHEYRFDTVDIEHLFTQATATSTSPTRH